MYLEGGRGKNVTNEELCQEGTARKSFQYFRWFGVNLNSSNSIATVVARTLLNVPYEHSYTRYLRARNISGKFGEFSSPGTPRARNISRVSIPRNPYRDEKRVGATIIFQISTYVRS